MSYFRPFLCLILGLATCGEVVVGDSPRMDELKVVVETPEFDQVGEAGSEVDQVKRVKPDADPRQSIQLVAATEPVATETSEEALQAKHETVASELRVAMLQEQVTQDTAGDPEPSNTKESNVDYLKQIDVTIAQQKAATSTLQDVQAKRAELEVKLSKLADGRLETEPPYSILVLDQLQDSINSGKAKQEALEASLLAAREAVERARINVEDRKKLLRQLKERAPADDPEVKAAELDVRLSEETLVLRRQELEIVQANQSVRSLQTKIDEQEVAIVSQNVNFTKETLLEQIAEIDARENELNRKVASLQLEIQYAERQWMSARQKLDTTANPPPALVEQVDALKLAQQTGQLELTVINQRLQRLPIIRTAWQKRHRVVSGDITREERRNWIAEAESQLDLLQRERRARELKLDEVRVNLGSVDSKIDAVNGGDPELKRWLQAEQRSLSKQIAIYNGGILAIDSARRVFDRLLTQMQGEKVRTPSEWAADAWAAANRIWNYELAYVDDASLTVGKALSSILFLFFGYFAARWLSKMLQGRLEKFGVDEAGSHAIESLTFYTLLFAFGLAALKYASVPLTAFTFLGGAIAIGIGFGSQNILNNFISGLILLAERPIKVGDLITIEGTHGNVTQIGARSTQIRTGENLDIIVPNSSFLENNVVNLTRRDDRIRTSINVGVAYGSPLELVAKILEQAASEHPGVQNKPKPFVWFNDFGDNALAFQVHFWISARTVAAMRKIETEVRYAIDRLFRENKIVIAFPQRDLHIQTPNPIEIRLVDDGNGEKFRKAA